MSSNSAKQHCSRRYGEALVFTLQIYSVESLLDPPGHSKPTDCKANPSPQSAEEATTPASDYRYNQKAKGDTVKYHDYPFRTRSDARELRSRCEQPSDDLVAQKYLPRAMSYSELLQFRSTPMDRRLTADEDSALV
jgi:hypothetical protein